MNTTPDTRSGDPEQIIADLQRQLAEREAERDEVQRNLDETTTERAKPWSSRLRPPRCCR